MRRSVWTSRCASAVATPSSLAGSALRTPVASNKLPGQPVFFLPSVLVFAIAVPSHSVEPSPAGSLSVADDPLHDVLRRSVGCGRGHGRTRSVIGVALGRRRRRAGCSRDAVRADPDRLSSDAEQHRASIVGLDLVGTLHERVEFGVLLTLWGLCANVYLVSFAESSVRLLD